MTTPVYSTTYPAGPTPPVPVDAERWTVSQWLKQPTVLNRFIKLAIDKNWLGGYLFRTGPANGGVVIFNEAAEEDQYVDATNGAPQPTEVLPGAEFPEVGFTEAMQTVARVSRRGAKFRVNEYQIRRDQRDVIGRMTTRLGNTLLRQENALLVATVRNHPRVPKVAVAVPWDNANPLPVGDITAAKGAVRTALDGLYGEPDTAIIHPDTAQFLLNMKEIYERLPRESTTGPNALFSGDLGGLFRLNWATLTDQPEDEITFVKAKEVGYLGEEIPQYTRRWDDPDTEDEWVKVARINVPVVTDPKAAYVLTGIFG